MPQKKGITGAAMETWENTLSEEEILYVYAYVNSLKNLDEMMEHHEQNNLNDINQTAFKSNGEYFKFRNAIVNIF